MIEVSVWFCLTSLQFPLSLRPRNELNDILSTFGLGVFLAPPSNVLAKFLN